MNFLPALKGFLLMASMIVAIGPQNAFLLRQAVRRELAWRVAAIFLFGDVAMISLGGFGIGHLLADWPWVRLALTGFGAVYILHFGINLLRQLRKPKTLVAHGVAVNTNHILSGALAVTFLNPHAILDTMVLVGSLALQFQGAAKSIFMLGAILASTLWFFGLAWVGQRLAPFLSRPDVWRVIDGLIVLVMLLLAVTLACDAWGQAKTLLQ